MGGEKNRRRRRRRREKLRKHSDTHDANEVRRRKGKSGGEAEGDIRAEEESFFLSWNPRMVSRGTSVRGMLTQ